MFDADKIFGQLRKKYRSNKNANWLESRGNLIRIVNSEIHSTKRKFLYNKIEKYFTATRISETWSIFARLNNPSINQTSLLQVNYKMLRIHM